MGLFAIAEGFVEPKRGLSKGVGIVELNCGTPLMRGSVGLCAFLSFGFFWLGRHMHSPLSVSKCEMTGNTEVRVWQVNQGYGMKVHVPAGVDAPLQVEACFSSCYVLLMHCSAVIAVYLPSS